MTDSERGFRFKMIGSFAIVYVVWGSTYVAIRFAIETLPGFTMAGARFMIAGLVLYAWARLRGAAHPNRRQWLNAAIIGGLLFLGGNGLVVWAEHHIPSGWAALLVGTEPLWITMMLFAVPGAGARPSLRTITSIVIGFVGVAVLTAPGLGGGLGSGGEVHLGAALVVLIAAAAWAAGSLIARQADLPDSSRMATAAQMLAGGTLLSMVGFGLGEWQGFDIESVSLHSLLAFVYLITFGSLVAFSAYIWLVRNVEPTLVATYAYVNPVVAVLLGWLLADEPVGGRTLVAMTLIVLAVVLLSLRRGTRRSDTRPKPPSQEPAAAASLGSPALDRSTS